MIEARTANMGLAIAAGHWLTKSSADKTFAGSVAAYYGKDSLVQINSLTYEETADYV